jgi:dephospho-CoA kinase
VVVLGLTGSIGMGKTLAARAFLREGAPVFDADAEVHRLLGSGGGGVRPVLAAFPDVGRDAPRGRAIDRKALGRTVFGDAAALRRLEGILHPLVREGERRFLEAARRRRVRLVVLDIPLLFETGGEARCDATAVVDAPAFVQRARVLRRPGMTEARYRDVLAHQMPSPAKRRRADFVIPTGLGRHVSWRAIRHIVRTLKERP